MASSDCLSDTQTIVTAGGFKDIHTARSSADYDLEQLLSDQEEADTRIFLHVRPAVVNGYERILVYSRDTDVLVLLVDFSGILSAKKLLMCASTQQKPTCFPVHAVRNSMPSDICEPLPGFHAMRV